MKKFFIAALLSFNSGFVDSVGFFGLQGLFTAHVTGNFVTMGSTLVFGTHGIIAKVLVIPEFVMVVALTRFAGIFLAQHQKPVVRTLFSIHLLWLFAFFTMAILYGPFADTDSPAALAASFMAVAAMAILNAAQRVYLTDLPPITVMTSNTTQASLDIVDFLRTHDPDKKEVVRMRLLRTLNSIIFFAAGCAAGSILYFHIGFWALTISTFVAFGYIFLGDD